MKNVRLTNGRLLKRYVIDFANDLLPEMPEEQEWFENLIKAVNRGYVTSYEAVKVMILKKEERDEIQQKLHDTGKDIQI